MADFVLTLAYDVLPFQGKRRSRSVGKRVFPVVVLGPGVYASGSVLAFVSLR